MASAGPADSSSTMERWALEVAELGLAVPLDHFLDADPPRHDRQIGRQRAGTAEAAEGAVIVIDESEEDLGGDVFDVGGRQDEAPRMGTW